MIRNPPAHLLTFVALALLGGCATQPPVTRAIEPANQSPAAINSAYTLDRNTFPLGPSWDAYRDDPDKIVGTINFVIPGSDGTCTKPDFQAGPSALMPDAPLKTHAVQDERYSSTVEGKYAGSLSFLTNRVDVSTDDVYDVTLKDISLITMPPDLSLLDEKKLAKIITITPEKFCSVIWVTGLKVENLMVKAYHTVSVQADASISLIKIDGKYYTNDGHTLISYPLVAVGENVTNYFGDCGAAPTPCSRKDHVVTQALAAISASMQQQPPGGKKQRPTGGKKEGPLEHLCLEQSGTTCYSVDSEGNYVPIVNTGVGNATAPLTRLVNEWQAERKNSTEVIPVSAQIAAMAAEPPPQSD